MNSPVHYVKDGPVAELVLNRPQARNALSPEMICRMADAVVDFSADDSLRVLILRAEGDKAFCAGGDLALSIPLLSGDREPVDEWDRRVLNDPVVMQASSLRDYPLHKPVICVVQGACFAAGFEIMLGTDIRIAASQATFCLPEVKRGILPFAGSMARLPRQIPYCRAMEILMTGEPFTAEEALVMGLVNRVVPQDQALAEARRLARLISANGPLALKELKKTVIEATGRNLRDGYQLEDAARRTVMASEDAKEGPRAFMEKREARFSGL